MGELCEPRLWSELGRRTGRWGAVVGAAMGLAWGTSLNPWVALASAVAAVCLITGVVSGRSAGTLVLVILGTLLTGYAALGRGFAYLGLPPVYAGEIALVCCALVLGTAVAVGNLRTPKLPALLWLFVGWCAIRTAVDLPRYGLWAVRDAAIWGYGAFSMIVAAVVRTSGSLAVTVSWYRALSPLLLCWYSLLAVLSPLTLQSILPSGPAGVPLLLVKPGDIAVHLAGIGSFLALGLHRRSSIARLPGRWWTACLLGILWAVCFLYYGSQNRGGLLALIAALIALSLIAWRKVGVIGAALGVVFAVVTNARHGGFDVGYGREVSPGQIIENLRSVSGGEDPLLEGTRQWRLRWWTTIVGYTVHGPYRWTGKGFGPNLADEDGFQVRKDGALRSPHNGHLTILARAGVPGLALWLSLQLWFGVSLLSRIRRLKQVGREPWRLSAWVFCYWVAAVVNAAFDVYLEGPQGGIWFWSLFGLGLSLIYEGRDRMAMVRGRLG